MSNNNIQSDTSTTIIIKKRGRKSKKELENKNTKPIYHNNSNENIIVNIEDNNIYNNIYNNSPNLVNDFLNSDNKNELEDYSDETNDLLSQNVLITDNNLTNSIIDNKPVAKKRGRKPKGGKIIHQILPLNNNKENRPNVILHLKCFLKDLKDLKDLNDNNLFGSDLDSFNFSKANLSEEHRIHAITLIASICYQNPKALNSDSLYNRLMAESQGLPSSSFEFVPMLFKYDDLIKN